jgi:hypothetical protein
MISMIQVPENTCPLVDFMSDWTPFSREDDFRRLFSVRSLMTDVPYTNFLVLVFFKKRWVQRSPLPTLCREEDDLEGRQLRFIILRASLRNTISHSVCITEMRSSDPDDHVDGELSQLKRRSSNVRTCSSSSTLAMATWNNKPCWTNRK